MAYCLEDLGTIKLYSLATIEITDFRGQVPRLVLHIDRHVTFLIGRNGTGKTSLINLINSALTVELRYLFQTNFESIKFRFVDDDRRRRQTILIKKQVEGGDPAIVYELSPGSKRPLQRFVLKADEFRSNWRIAQLHYSITGTRALRNQIPDAQEVASKAVREIIHTSWLSVNRGKVAQPQNADQKFETPIDRKLHQVARDFGTYFSILDKQAAEETDKFQQVYLLALISPSKYDSLSSLGKVDIEEEKAAIKGVFGEFKVAPSAYNSKLDAFIRRMRNALSRYREGPTQEAEGFLVLTDMVRIHDVIKEWHKLVAARAKIYEPKSDFVSILNSLLFRKQIEISQGNEPTFTDDAGNAISIDDLSSGEKQMFILLGETLLQRRAKCIFMADEPELSLHIDWQEKLVPSLRRINPNAQILFATHSPDIVGEYSKSAINLEKLI